LGQLTVQGVDIKQLQLVVALLEGITEYSHCFYILNNLAVIPLIENKYYLQYFLTYSTYFYPGEASYPPNAVGAVRY
jgi:hypothetical protein